MSMAGCVDTVIPDGPAVGPVTQTYGTNGIAVAPKVTRRKCYF